MSGDQTERKPTVRTTYFGGVDSAYAPIAADRVYGVVRKPHDWVDDVVDRNIPALAPPRDVKTAFKSIEEALKNDGVSNPTAKAWSDRNVGVEDQYREYLTRAGPRQVLAEIVDTLDRDDVASVVLVGYRKNPKFCHRRLLADELADRADGDVEHFPDPYETADDQGDAATDAKLNRFKTGP